MHYSISGLCPASGVMSSHGFVIRLFSQWREMVARSGFDQTAVDEIIEREGRRWLDACGYGEIFDPDNCGFGMDPKKKPGPHARPLYNPFNDLHVKWGEWGPEHICVPGNACGLDIDDAICSPRGGMALLPHNVDTWEQKQLLLIVFTWFDDHMSMMDDLRGEEEERP